MSTGHFCFALHLSPFLSTLKFEDLVLSSSASADCLYTSLIRVLASASQACFRFAGGQPSLKGHPLRIAELNLLECYRRRHRMPSNSRNDSTRILPICPCEVVQAPDVQISDIVLRMCSFVPVFQLQEEAMRTTSKHCTYLL